jgi:hypothetical protein
MKYLIICLTLPTTTSRSLSSTFFFSFFFLISFWNYKLLFIGVIENHLLMLIKIQATSSIVVLL